jgi:hypothetical protein
MYVVDNLTIPNRPQKENPRTILRHDAGILDHFSFRFATEFTSSHRGIHQALVEETLPQASKQHRPLPASTSYGC